MTRTVYRWGFCSLCALPDRRGRAQYVALCDGWWRANIPGASDDEAITNYKAYLTKEGVPVR